MIAVALLFVNSEVGPKRMMPLLTGRELLTKGEISKGLEKIKDKPQKSFIYG